MADPLPSFVHSIYSFFCVNCSGNLAPIHPFLLSFQLVLVSFIAGLEVPGQVFKVFFLFFSSKVQRTGGEKIWFIPTVFSSFRKGFNKFFSSHYPWFSASSSSLVSVFPSFLLQLYQLAYYTPFLVMVLAIFWYSLTLISSLRFKRDACRWVGGLLFKKRERVCGMQLTSFSLGKREIDVVQGYWPPIQERGKVILPLSLHLYPLLNERGGVWVLNIFGFYPFFELSQVGSYSNSTLGQAGPTLIFVGFYSVAADSEIGSKNYVAADSKIDSDGEVFSVFSFFFLWCLHL